MLTARNAQFDRTLPLELDADDYTTKPCSIANLFHMGKFIMQPVNFKIPPLRSLAISLT